jgi:hypothetical protein
MQRKFAFIALACCATVASAAEVYKWTDAGGVVHYADTEPAAALNAQRLHVRGSGTTEAGANGEAARSAGAADTDTGPQADAAALAGTKVVNGAEAAARRCQQARANLEQLQSNYPVGLDAAGDGKAQALTVAAREQQTRRAQTMIAAYCK